VSPCGLTMQFMHVHTISCFVLYYNINFFNIKIGNAHNICQLAESEAITMLYLYYFIYAICGFIYISVLYNNFIHLHLIIAYRLTFGMCY